MLLKSRQYVKKELKKKLVLVKALCAQSVGTRSIVFFFKFTSRNTLPTFVKNL